MPAVVLASDAPPVAQSVTAKPSRAGEGHGVVDEPGRSPAASPWASGGRSRTSQVTSATVEAAAMARTAASAASRAAAVARRSTSSTACSATTFGRVPPRTRPRCR